MVSIVRKPPAERCRLRRRKPDTARSSGIPTAVTHKGPQRGSRSTRLAVKAGERSGDFLRQNGRARRYNGVASQRLPSRTYGGTAGSGSDGSACEANNDRRLRNEATAA